YFAAFCVPPENKKSRFRLEIRILLSFAFLQSGATRNRKSVCMTLFLNKLYLYHDVSPLNKVFTALHRSTQVCILGTISECKDKTLFDIMMFLVLNSFTVIYSLGYQ
ncbi:hypothetical protein, partial [uncultured Bacteroides sp.]|uniref:hypothetical protein n=1 Tax=uncultured Bacteroides sp. TaxID=162156 RepID=UPI00322063A6